MIKVSHMILCLNANGAEFMLFRLLSGMDRSAFAAEVISLMKKGAIGEKIAALGIPVRTIGLRRDLRNPYCLARVAYWLRKQRPDVIQTWMYHANFVGSLIAPLAVKAPVVWGIHHSNLDPLVERRRTIWIARACGWMSRRLVAKVVCCSEASRIEHERLGYARDKMEVVPNGFDLAAFRPDAAARESVRRELGLEQDSLIIGHPGRFHKQKDHQTFLVAAGLIHERISNAYFVLCGSEVTWQNRALVAWIEEAGIRHRCRLLGSRPDMARLFPSMDVVCSSSCVGEAFPLAVGEAMACGVPCVVTDVGDSAILVGDTGLVVPPRDPRLLAGALTLLLKMQSERRWRLGEMARARIAVNYDLSRTVERYHSIYEEVIRAAKQRDFRKHAPEKPSATPSLGRTS